MVKISNPMELSVALSEGQTSLVLTRSMVLSSSVVLPKEVEISSVPQENGVLPTLFFSDSDGLILQGNSQISNMSIVVPQDKKAISLVQQQHEEDFGDISLKNVTVDGQISLIFRKPTMTARVMVDGVHVSTADTRGYLEQPQKYGVNVLQGAFTLYNFNPDAESLIKATINRLSVGSEGHPVFGSGVFVSGFSDQGGQVDIAQMTLGAIYSTGLIPQGVASLITAGVFVVYGASVKELHQEERVVTYGVNDMVLDAWGRVEHWLVKDQLISYGQSGVGFVNFGEVDYFEARDSISTFGTGARAYNQYDGSLNKGVFKDINTYNNGAVGIQVSKRVGELVIKGNLITNGGIGESLVKGVNVELPAYALSIKDGGNVGTLKVEGDIQSNGEGVTTIIVEEGAVIGSVSVQGQIEANGRNATVFDSSQTETYFK